MRFNLFGAYCGHNNLLSLVDEHVRQTRAQQLLGEIIVCVSRIEVLTFYCGNCRTK